MRRIYTHNEARAAGFIIDDVAAGRPCAYKGARFRPTELVSVHTDLEERMLGLLIRASNMLSQLSDPEASELRLDIAEVIIRDEG